MQTVSRRTGGLHRPGIALLLAVVLALAFIRAGQPLHLHHGTTAGLYNEEHVLAALDSVTGDAPLPAADGVRLDVATVRAQLPAAVEPDGPAVSRSAPRAPPVA